METEPVKSGDDAADDPAIWINQHSPVDSLVLGTDKQSGLYVFDLHGKSVEYVAAGNVNNVDVHAWRIDGERRLLVGATERSRKELVFFFLDPVAGSLQAVPGGNVPLDLGDPYGFCLVQPRTGASAAPLYAFATGKSGALRQFRLDWTEGAISAVVVRSLNIGSIAEGCVGDDRTGEVYIGEETVAIWKYAADPGSGERRELFAEVGSGPLVADVEGLALHPRGATGGWLIASSQGDSSFAAYDLASGDHLGSFRIGANEELGIDAVSGTDGIALAPHDSLPGFPGGLFVVQDDVNQPLGAQNFKLVAWDEVVEQLSSRPTEVGR